MAAAVDTLHKDMTFHATGIDPVTVPNEVFGWQIDQEAEIAQLTSELQNSVVTVREPVYASRAVAAENNGIGTTYVEIDLASFNYIIRRGRDGSAGRRRKTAAMSGMRL